MCGLLQEGPVNTILGNIKSALRGTCHAIRPKYAQRYLAEFEYRFNRRFDLPDIIPRLLYVALRTPPMPERLLKLVESRTGAPVLGSGGGSVAFAPGLSPAPLTTFPVPAHQTGRADLRHPMLSTT